MGICTRWTRCRAHPKVDSGPQDYCEADNEPEHATDAEELSSTSQETEELGCPHERRWWWCYCAVLGLVCACCILVLLACAAGILFVAELLPSVPTHSPDGHLLTPPNLSNFVVWPGCRKGWKNSMDFEACAPPCFGPELLEAVESFNSKHSFRRVNFESRRGTESQVDVRLAGWWLPPPSDRTGPNPAPRVVLQHGFAGGSNDWSIQLTAFLLRSIGFGVLALDLRNHGLSGTSGNRFCTWGWDYVFDLLGAWDYAVADPDGLLGGPLPASQVGLVGFSMGGFVASTAFGLEEQVPAAWVDSGVFDPKDILHNELSKYTGLLESLLFPFAWWSAKMATFVPSLDQHTPAKEIPKGPSTRRPVSIVHNRQDSLVPLKESHRLAELLRALPEQYEVRAELRSDVNCNGETHLVAALRFPDRYRQELCTFWSHAFNRSERLCGLDLLPRVGRGDDAGFSPA